MSGMSNKRTLRRAVLARKIADRYRCGHCAARMRTAQVAPGVLLLDVFHDGTCPVLRGQVGSGPDLLRAVAGLPGERRA
jgi:hypothetical protein